ncbi:MAG: glycerol kinase GlpK [Saprospiraceae bacterium]|jgi:glycerol kinase
MKKYVLAIDAGTTSSRAILFDHNGQQVGVAQYEFPQYFPKEGWVEHDANEIWDTQLRAIKSVLVEQGVQASEISAIGITNQRETTVVWDKETGKPVGKAIVWQDRRTASTCQALTAAAKDQIFLQKTGLVLDAYFSGTKIKWILDQNAELKEKASNGGLAFGTIDSWLIWNLTSGKHHITDVTNASRTLLFNIHTLKWDEELLNILEIPKSMLPEVADSSQVIGHTEVSLLGEAIPIAGIAGDQQAALFGQLCLHPGDVKNTYGTGCFAIMNTGNQPVHSKNKMLTTIGWKIGKEVVYALEGSVFIAGALIQWLRDNLGIIKSAPEVENLAASVEDNGGVTFIPALSGLGAPHWDSGATGAIFGITRGTSKGHIARAALEAIALSSRDIIVAMEKDAGTKFTNLKVDGGASNNNLLMQMQANLLGERVIRPKITETTAIGAAFLAGLATGFWKDIQALESLWQEERVFTPNHLLDTDKIIKNWEKNIAKVLTH